MKRVGLVIGGMVLVLGGIILLSKENHSKIYVEEQKVNEETSLVFMLQDGEGNYSKSDTLPSNGYTLNANKSVCSDGAIPTWENQELYLSKVSKKGTNCYLYFDIKPLASNTILAGKDIQTRNDFSTTLTSDTTGIIYQAEDDDGTTYYFAGNPSDNWVKFGGYYWRIIRINGDGSIRLIYQGTSANTTGSETQISTSAFNTSNNNNMYVGYMYESGVVHGLKEDSTIKGVLDTWYKNNLLDYTDQISKEAGFCGDRTSTTSSSGAPNDTGGTGMTTTYYGAYYRLQINKIPTLECDDASKDLYTVSNSSKGNKALDYPIGLITADEVAYAGGVYGINNTGYYLYINQYYWTMSPSQYGSNNIDARVFRVDLKGYIDGNNGYTTAIYGVRPVINLASDVMLSGSGTSSDPYVVEGA